MSEGLIFEWKGGSSEGELRGVGGCIAHTHKRGDGGYLADLWEYQGKVHLDCTMLIDGELLQERETIQKTDLENSRFESAEDWADVKMARFLEAHTDWRRP